MSVLNDSNVGIYTLIKTLQNNEKYFSNKLKKIKFNKSTFKSEFNKKEFKSDLEYATNQYILYRMSRGGLCQTYSWSIGKKNQSDLCSWNTPIENLSKISQKLLGVFVFNKNPIEIIQKFNCDNVLLYCNMPCYCGNKCIKSPYKSEIEQEDHVEISKLLLKSTSKVILNNLDSNLYKKLYKSFNRKKVINNKNKIEYIWKNF